MTIVTTEPVAILGAGAWGLSTALHLLNSGCTSITVYDQASQIPSPYSGAYDLNKIVRAEYEDEFYTELALVGRPRNGILIWILQWMLMLGLRKR
jgi:sarcosine oxidase/L-pipecolate oxidase